MASLFKKGPYWYLEFKDKNGAWKNKSTGLRWDDPKETKQAQLIRAKAEGAEIAMDITKAAKEGWDWVDEYLQTHCLNAQTLARYMATWEMFMFWMGKAGVKSPRELSHNSMVEYIKWRTGTKKKSGKTVSQNTAIMDLRIMSQVMAEAVRRNLADKNPARGHGFRKTKPKKKPDLSDEEIQKIWAALKEEEEWMRDSFLIALHTGCRLRETIIPLKCIDLVAKTITFPAPKGGEEKAFTIPMPSALEPLFRRMIAEGRKVTLEMPFQPSRKWGQAEVPWARPGSGFTLMMEAIILLLGQQMSVSAVARHLGESDKRLWRVLDHYVMAAHAAKDWSAVRQIMIDETSAKKGHRYVTVVLDAQSHDLLLMVEGRRAEAVANFVAAMPAHGAKAEEITEVVMDMSPAYIAGVQTHFPNARIVFDLFHIMKLAGEALDAVRKNLRKQGADLTGGLWAVRGNEWTRSQEQLDLRRVLARSYPVLGRALALRDSRQEVLADGDLPSIRWWLGWADRSRLAPFRKLSRTLKEHFHGILAYLDTRLTNAAIEAVNGLLQMAKRIARGFRNFHYFRIAAYLKAGRLNLQIPLPLPT